MGPSTQTSGASSAISMSLSTKMFSSTSMCGKTVFGSSVAAQDRMRDYQGIDRETVDILYTANWGRADNTGTVKDDIKMLVREEMFRVKEEQRGSISRKF